MAVRLNLATNLLLIATLALSPYSHARMSDDLDTQLHLLATHAQDVRAGKSLPAPFYGILNETIADLNQPCLPEVCDPLDMNKNGKRLPDFILKILAEDVNAVYQSRDLSLFAFNVFYYRLGSLLSLYPAIGHHPLELEFRDEKIYNYDENNNVSGYIIDSKVFQNNTLYVDRLERDFVQTLRYYDDLLEEFPTEADFNGFFLSYDQMKSFFTHVPADTILSPDGVKDENYPLALSVWNMPLTIEDINKMMAQDVAPLGLEPSITVAFDGQITPPIGLWIHDAICHLYEYPSQEMNEVYQEILAVDSHHSVTLPPLSHFWMPKGAQVPLARVLQTVFFFLYHESPTSLQFSSRITGFSSQRHLSCDGVKGQQLVVLELILLDQGIIAKNRDENEILYMPCEAKDLNECECRTAVKDLDVIRQAYAAGFFQFLEKTVLWSKRRPQE